ncbi:hypothetical protein [Streptomyces erythrochromogenes]|uniref:hypothetical protein n=1 Tax=Streptomyces erythrochromogenes TaxID=285574 RepID=UPI00367AA16E
MTADTSARISLIDLLLLAEPLANRLGSDWTRIETTSDPKTIQYGHATGTVLGIRHLWDGAAAQTYVLIEGEPTYHAGVTFREDTSIDDSLMEVITTRLLPAMDGHRPKLRQNGTPQPPKDAEPDESPTAGEQRTEADAAEPKPVEADQPDPAPAAGEPEAQTPAKAAPAPKARPRAKKTATGTSPAAPKKTTPRRTTARKTKAATTA